MYKNIKANSRTVTRRTMIENMMIFATSDESFSGLIVELLSEVIRVKIKGM